MKLTKQQLVEIIKETISEGQEFGMIEKFIIEDDERYMVKLPGVDARVPQERRVLEQLLTDIIDALDLAN